MGLGVVEVGFIWDIMSINSKNNRLCWFQLYTHWVFVI